MKVRKVRDPILDKLYAELKRCGDLSCTGKPFEGAGSGAARLVIYALKDVNHLSSQPACVTRSSGAPLGTRGLGPFDPRDCRYSREKVVARPGRR
jgi:hypothetical protein